MTIQTSILQITYSNELSNGGELHVSSNCLPAKASHFEPAGHSFHEVALKLCGCFTNKSKKTEDSNVSSHTDKDNEHTQSSDAYNSSNSSKGKKKSGESNQQDHYALLSLGTLRYLATDEQIRKSYRETALKYHPDKLAALLLSEETEAGKQSKKDEIENRFKAIQEAYEVLIDPVKRRVFDSTDEFDDEIPTDCSPQDFFKVFGPAFLRNGRWSVTQPTPFLGDENTPLDDVDSFYDFWYGFKSWREFPHADEHDLEEAESRDEKRWMERQNAKLSEKARKEEYARIRSLVDNAYKRDPRVLKRKEMLKAEKQKKKEAKFMVKKLQEEEAARVAEEERLKKEEAEKQAAEAAAQQKKIKEKEKKLLRKERTRLRTISSNVVTQRLLDLNHDDVENLCMSLDILKLKGLCDDMETQEETMQAELLKKAVKNLDHCISNYNQQNGHVKVNGYVPKQENKKLTKTVVQKPLSTRPAQSISSPPSTPGGKATEAIKVSPIVDKNAEEIVENGVKEDGDEWSVAQVTSLIQAMKRFPKEANQRWERVAAAVPGKTVSQCKKQFSVLQDKFKSKKK